MKTILKNNEMEQSLQGVEKIIDWEDSLRFLDIKLINVADFSELIIRFAFNLLIIFMAIHYLYGKNSNRKDFYFSYFAVGISVFLLSYLLNNVKLELGFALGLFAIFGIIRYRTDAIPIKEMTYLFVVIGISVMNALVSKKVSYAELIFANMIVISLLWVLEKRLKLKEEKSIKLIYEKIENIHRKSEADMLSDLTARTGIQITRYEFIKIDFLRDVAEVVIFYGPNGGKK